MRPQRHIVTPRWSNSGSVKRVARPLWKIQLIELAEHRRSVVAGLGPRTSHPIDRLQMATTPSSAGRQRSDASQRETFLRLNRCADRNRELVHRLLADRGAIDIYRPGSSPARISRKQLVPHLDSLGGAFFADPSSLRRRAGRSPTDWD